MGFQLIRGGQSPVLRDPRGMFDLKRRPGGMVDIELMVQNGVVWWDGAMIPWPNSWVDLLTHSLQSESACHDCRMGMGRAYPAQTPAVTG